VLAFALPPASAPAGVVVNEILYHAPDHLDELQFVELHNPGDKSVDLAGWKLAGGAKYTFPAGTTLDSDGYLVVCKNLKEFRKYYGFDAAGQFEGSLKHGNDQVTLLDAAGKKIDSVRYRSRAPWPLGADGCSSSLERICPTSAATGPENWAPSPPVAAPRRTFGTPGKKNANYAAQLPPAVTNVTFTPAHASPEQAIQVEAEVKSPAGVRSVELLYRLCGSGYEKAEQALPMSKSPKGRYAASIPAQRAGQIVRFRVKATDAKGGERVYPNANEVRPALSVYVHDTFKTGKIPFGLIVHVGRAEFQAAQRGAGFRGYAMPPGPTPPVRGNCAFVWVDQKTGVPTLFDFLSITPRSGGRKVRFHKDRPLNDMTTINLIYEYMDRFVLAEPLAYEVYRKAGNVACRTDFVRTWVDGQPIGFQLLIEQPNKAFLRYNKLRTDGNLYKCQWFGRDLASSHELKTHTKPGHEDLAKLITALSKTRGEAQWELIKKNFDVEQVINYFAVNMVLSHWDGFFNNYFTYYDHRGSGKWTMYPWDQDKTWGFHDGLRGYDIFFDMPITFGMQGDVPPGYPKFLPPPSGFGFNAWWRPGGVFSKPLLANPRFRKLFLARTKEILEKVYTEEVMFPLIKAVEERLDEEVQVRGKLMGMDARQSREHLKRNLDALREHLKKRRDFLLAQDEIKKAGAFDRSELK
jgi:hypothetical protein